MSDLDFSWLIGEELDDSAKEQISEMYPRVRYISPGSIIDGAHNRMRLNIYTDENNIVTKYRFG